MRSSQTKTKTEFGDFQTPLWFAEQVCTLLRSLGISPHTAIEPTCGVGNFLVATMRSFPELTHVIGCEINSKYLEIARCSVAEVGGPHGDVQVDLFQGDFFDVDWSSLLSDVAEPLLVVGNPPWVTNSTLSAIDGNNLPQKGNFHRRAGIEAITGASNFDISEWMLLKMASLAQERSATIAVLCKTAVARKVLTFAWEHNYRPAASRIYMIDAQGVFGAAVDACLFVCDFSSALAEWDCLMFPTIYSSQPSAHWGIRDHLLVANTESYDRLQHLRVAGRRDSPYVWRSGIKHDCAQVMELTRSAGRYLTKSGESWDLESDLLYPLCKGSDIVGHGRRVADRWLLVPQRNVGDDTSSIRVFAPRTWAYLSHFASQLDARQSSIYRNRPRFSIFGVGDYSFSNWKVVVSGMHKVLKFVVVGPSEGKPVVLDDTCYSLACQNQEEAEFIAELLNSATAKQFYEAFIFWDDKRPITAKLLHRLDLAALARQLGRAVEYDRLSIRPTYSEPLESFQQLQLLEKRSHYQA
jgi:hypothetical protein